MESGSTDEKVTGTTASELPVSNTKKRAATESLCKAEDKNYNSDVASDSNKNKRKKKIRSKHLDPEILEIRQTIQKCCATDDLVSAMQIYDSAAASSVEPQSLYNLLNLCGGLSGRGIHVGTPISNNNKKGTTKSKEIADEEKSVVSNNVDMATRQQHAERIMSHMRELQIPLTESCYTAMIKLFSRNARVENAETLLEEAERTQQCRPRLRMYSPLLRHYCEIGKTVAALRVWLRLTRQDLTLSEREYTALLQCACQVGDATLMERVLSDLSEDVLVPSHDTRQAIVDWFQSPAAVAAVASSSDPEVRSLLEEIKVPYPYPAEPIGPIVIANHSTSASWSISDGCEVDSQGVLQSGCLKGARLKAVATSAEIWEELKRMNESIVLSGRVDGDHSDFQGGRKGLKRVLDEATLEHRRRDWSSLGRYLESRQQQQRSIDVVVDAANVGFFETNYAGAPKHVDYQQIDWIVEHFVAQNKSVLVFLHERHVSRPLMPRHAEPLVQQWRQRELLYVTPKGMNDDWFWLHAALMFHCHVVTNDEMRDHHFQMLAPRGFGRWKDRHQVHFRFGAWHPDKKQGRIVELVYPAVYSRRLHRVEDGLVVPLPKRGDENRFLDGSHQVDDSNAPAEETYLCIRPNNSSSTS